MTFIMTPEEREAFLADLHVGIVSVAEEERGPLSVPIWYGYEPGGNIWFVTGQGSRKIRLLKKSGRLSLCVQNEQSPYQYVSVEGALISIQPMDIDHDLVPLAYKYLGPEEGEEYVQEERRNPQEGSVLVQMHPEHWYAVDYGKED
jgi:nitroimidazol reductase NimA-like FMN-containing flavoprotein (pyridoxamine 5'-phosphate oxidase superfamily)